MVHDDVELDAARPNDSARRATLDLLDIADRAGVQITGLSVSVSDGRAWAANLHGSRPGGTHMTHTDALRIALRMGDRAALNVSAVGHSSGTPHVVIRGQRRGLEVSIFCEPSPAQLAELARTEADRAAARAARFEAAAGGPL